MRGKWRLHTPNDPGKVSDDLVQRRRGARRHTRPEDVRWSKKHRDRVRRPKGLASALAPRSEPSARRHRHPGRPRLHAACRHSVATKSSTLASSPQFGQPGIRASLRMLFDLGDHLVGPTRPEDRTRWRHAQEQGVSAGADRPSGALRTWPSSEGHSAPKPSTERPTLWNFSQCAASLASLKSRRSSVPSISIINPGKAGCLGRSSSIVFSAPSLVRNESGRLIASSIGPHSETKQCQSATAWLIRNSDKAA